MLEGILLVLCREQRKEKKVPLASSPRVADFGLNWMKPAKDEDEIVSLGL